MEVAFIRQGRWILQATLGQLFLSPEKGHEAGLLQA